MKLFKERDEAWSKVESLAMRHPNYNSTNKVVQNKSHPPTQQENAPPDEDGDNDQTPLTLEKIEAKANEVIFFSKIIIINNT